MVTTRHHEYQKQLQHIAGFPGMAPPLVGTDSDDDYGPLPLAGYYALSTNKMPLAEYTRASKARLSRKTVAQVERQQAV